MMESPHFDMASLPSLHSQSLVVSDFCDSWQFFLSVVSVPHHHTPAISQLHFLSLNALLNFMLCKFSVPLCDAGLCFDFYSNLSGAAVFLQ